ncbi:MAG: hypothetical protein BIFFINMI_00956 [Phycisphaerae bacterium]|nr:hypothetical protein [Phycisphaerae bacterium]
MKDIARTYLDAGLCVLPAKADEKRPALDAWKQYRSRRPTTAELDAWFANGPDALCVLTGAPSGNFEAVDFDLAGEAFEPWCERVRQAAPGLLERLVIERTPSTGWHAGYRCESPVCGSIKLAQRKVYVDNGEPVYVGNKKYIPRRDSEGRWHIVLTLIETRGEGGLILCAPSPGYALHQGEFTSLPVLTEAERDVLLEAAWALNEHLPEPVTGLPAVAHSGSLRPGDDFNARGGVRELLLKHGWALAKGGDNEYWRRPGKDRGWSATLKDRVFYVFSSSAAPFEPEKAYGPFAVFALLEHNGDFSAAAQALRTQGFGGDIAPAPDVDLSHFDAAPPDPAPQAEPAIADPGPIPEHLFRVPGFIEQVMEFTLANAPYPSVGLAFCGAVALQSYLCGRKVRDDGDLRPNIYLLALASSGTGKDYPRKVNSHVLFQIGHMAALGDKFASGQGIQDALARSAAMLFQNDEMDGVLRQINFDREGKSESIPNILLTLYTSADVQYPLRVKAGQKDAGHIDQPHLTLFGTATPQFFYESLSQRMLTNGFFARLIIVDVGKRGAGQKAGPVSNLPEPIIETARWWGDFQPGSRRGNLIDIHPEPIRVLPTPEAEEAIEALRVRTEAEYDQAHARNDEPSRVAWSRTCENAKKLALLYACSENHAEPVIGLPAVQWATEFAMHQTRRQLYLATTYVAENPFHAECLKLIRRLRDAPGQQMQRQHLLRAMRCKSFDFDQIASTLVQQGEIVRVDIPSKTKTAEGYRIP